MLKLKKIDLLKKKDKIQNNSKHGCCDQKN
jgi:hypothetical protein